MGALQSPKADHQEQRGVTKGPGTRRTAAGISRISAGAPGTGASAFRSRRARTPPGSSPRVYGGAAPVACRADEGRGRRRLALRGLLRRERLRDLEPLPVFAGQELGRLLLVPLERLGLAVELQRMAGEIGDVGQVRQRRRQVPFQDLAGEHLRIVGADRVDEVLVVRELDGREPLRLGRLLRRFRARALLVLGADRSHVGLPLAAALLDPQPALRAEEQVADAYAPFVRGVLAARAELEDRAVGILEERRLH